MLQQHLPFTVLKRSHTKRYASFFFRVATALTVYGIETMKPSSADVKFVLQQHLPFTVLKQL